MKGWRPISVTYQPASVATQPEKVMPASSQQQRARQRVAGCQRARRQRSTQPTSDIASISMPMPTITRKRQNTAATGGCASRKLVQPLDLAVEVVRQDQAGELRAPAIA